VLHLLWSRPADSRFNGPVRALKNWEQGRRAPDVPPLAYLLAIKRRPKEIMEAVS
jgi:putative transcriptional regulator